MLEKFIAKNMYSKEYIKYLQEKEDVLKEIETSKNLLKESNVVLKIIRPTLKRESITEDERRIVEAKIKEVTDMRDPIYMDLLDQRRRLQELVQQKKYNGQSMKSRFTQIEYRIQSFKELINKTFSNDKTNND